ncbi:MAG: hypothetical protein CBD76_01190 [Pelagibacteraceae bacterium TMED216]|nr:MAG: hypothetical protein CBD76_01190 [Pelagibacteraceae bacterium TMED216]|tara:strand:- start:169 stop:762 length:594 start_codon:yes stop_codon:yes gene_type:complete
MKIKIKKILFILIIIFGFNNNVFTSENLFLGDSQAKITVKVFSSLTCPHCADFHSEVFEKLKNEFIDKKIVRFEHHGFPLDLAALNAEKILRCTNSKEKSFSLLNKIYRDQNKWAIGTDINKINVSIMEIGLKANLNKDKMKNCLIDEKIQDQILDERIEAQKKYKISSTPSIFINEKKYEGKLNYKDFKKHLNKLL